MTPVPQSETDPMSTRPSSSRTPAAGIALSLLAATLLFPLTAEAVKKPPKGKNALVELQTRIAYLEQLKDEVEALQAEMEELKAFLSDGTNLSVVESKTPMFDMLKPFAHVTVRYDNIWTSDLTDINSVPFEGLLAGTDPTDAGIALLSPNQGGYVGGFRTKVRMGMKLVSDSAFLVGGFRGAVGQNPNPASSFVPLGDVFRPTGFGLDQYWLDVRPLKGERDRLSLKAGKMPNPLFRGQVKGSGFASEMIWDNDVNPAGVAIDTTIIKADGFKLRNIAAYYVVQDTEAFRFRGLTGETSLILDQIRVETEWFTASVAYLGFENLNAGLRAPGISSDHSDSGDVITQGAAGGAFVEPGTTANLLRPGLQATNNRVNYGPGASGFLGGDKAAFRLVNITLQGHLQLSVPNMDRFTVHFMADYVVNLSAQAIAPAGFTNERAAERHGISGSVGTAFAGGKLKGFDIWGTYRFVQADATVSAIADSDLGRGTEYHGGEIAAAITLAKNFKLGVAFFNFWRFPDYEVQDTRFFIDAIASF